MVTAWCVGEYGEMLVSNAGLLDGETPLAVSSQPAWQRPWAPAAQSDVSHCLWSAQNDPAKCSWCHSQGWRSRRASELELCIPGQPVLMRPIACCGSWQVSEGDVLAVLDKGMRDPRASTNLRACIMLALLKLTLRFPSSLE